MAAPAAGAAIVAWRLYRLYKKRKKIKKAGQWVYEKGKWVWRGKTAKETLDELRKVRYEKKTFQSHKHRKSQRGLGSATKRTGRPKSRKTMRARSARRPRFVPYRKGGCPPGYRYDPRRKMCIQINYK